MKYPVSCSTRRGLEQLPVARVEAERLGELVPQRQRERGHVQRVLLLVARAARELEDAAHPVRGARLARGRLLDRVQQQRLAQPLRVDLERVDGEQPHHLGDDERRRRR